ncbi:organic cation transporter protein-like isoform X2 [Athalia rosae]|uniref:organic cation transporter protein-like isoform X2 n=1 Tax=Athalia rosae TaxID=37344 RepID=UPI0020338C96|nr:organic cation transporter protein-like isoform X2 [Athalia rosae]
MTFDDVVVLTGQFGRYQWRIYFLLCLPVISVAFHSMSGVFLGAEPDFRCLLSDESSQNATFQLPPDFMDTVYPWDSQTGSWSQCEKYVNFTDAETMNSTSTVKCSSFVYDKSIYELTTTTEFNLVCNKSWMRATVDSLLMVGIMLGALIFGGLSDKFGRKTAFLSAIVINVISGFLLAATPEVVSYMIVRLILGTSVNAIFLIAYIMAVEMVGPSHRNTIGVIVQLFSSTGVILTSVIAYFIRHWRYLQIAVTAPSVAFLTYWWLIPESARWLLSMGYVKEAKTLLLEASSKNGITLSKEQLDNMLSDTIASNSAQNLEKHSVLDLMRYPNLRRRSLLLFVNWYVNNMTYYGLSWNTSNLADWWGRKPILCGCMLLAGISLLLSTLVPDDMQWLVILLTMLGKLSITASYETMYIISAEQYPTVIRNVGVGACSTCARIGGATAPYILYTANIWKSLPVVIFGSLAFIFGLSTILLPETLNKKLPETIQEGEEFGK